MSNTLVTALEQLVDELKAGTYGRSETPLSADEIREIRTNLGLSRADFCEWLGVSIETVKSWEIGRRSPSPMVNHVLHKCKISHERENV